VSGPALVVRIEFERSLPLVFIECQRFEDWLRLRDWLVAHPELEELAGVALDLADGERAA
jgi:hypothetical protein